jgi:hypothetical protein
MSQSFKCDICGNCVATEAEAQAEREEARESTTILGVQVDIGIIVKVYKQHVCDTCWVLVRQKVKAWIQANL